MGLIRDVLTGRVRAHRAYNRHIAQLYEGGKITRQRRSASRQFSSPEDQRETSERLQMIREARNLEDNYPIAALILDAYEVYALGSIRYQPMTGDPGRNRAIMDWLSAWFSDCDITGRLNFSELARLALRGKKRDGESAIIHRMTDDGQYRLQLIGGDRIGDPTAIAWSQKSDEHHGIHIADTGEVTAYDIYRRSADTATYRFDAQLPASMVSHVYDPFRPDQYHGVTAFRSIITRMQDLREVLDYTRLNIKHRATQLPYWKTESGDMPAVNTEYRDDIPIPNEHTDDGVRLDTVGGAEQQFLRVGEGVFEYPNDFPNQQFGATVESMIREILAGVGLAYEFLWNPEKLTGTVGRLIVERQDRVMRLERERMERQFMRTAIRRAIQSGVDLGVIGREGPELFNGEFFYGARISADYGRDNNTDIALVRAGLLTETEYQHIHGRSPERMREVRLSEATELAEDAEKIAIVTGMEIENAMNLLRQNYGAPPVAQSESKSVSKSESVSETKE